MIVGYLCILAGVCLLWYGVRLDRQEQAEAAALYDFDDVYDDEGEDGDAHTKKAQGKRRAPQ